MIWWDCAPPSDQDVNTKGWPAEPVWFGAVI
jgi:hypothetical protein